MARKRLSVKKKSDDVLMETAELAGRVVEESRKDRSILLQVNDPKPKLIEIS